MSGTSIDPKRGGPMVDNDGLTVLLWSKYSQVVSTKMFSIKCVTERYQNQLIS
ncbi:hypothetical protein KIN20_004190, partial [Parelaphostrongylus tenuis]